ncbi:sensor domain-containing diguanylate cyclase [Stenotrophomonas sp. PS02289]|uniref:sensor domain-containing diguanylate cyclase n=1 Tax=Stenotrophomonas sp. PS02289 TaxID=2991422 RepID=UPI00249C241F|nr:sensor domain-containing diguanylate cyclase [Stenotrophomonas sp. PS02289]
MSPLPSRLTLGKLILALALLSAIVALANTLHASYRVQREQLIGNTLEANRVYASKLAETTQNFLLAAQQQLAYSAKGLGSRAHSVQELEREAARLQQQTNDFNSVLIVDRAGTVLATSPQSLALQGVVLNSSGNTEALKRREPYISDPYQSATGRLLVAITQPIFNTQGQYQGYVSGTIYLRQRSILQTLLGKHYYRDGSYLYVVDRNARILYHIEPNRIGQFAKDNPAVQAVSKGQSGAQEVRNSHGVLMLAGYAPVPAVGWGVVAQRPTEATLAQLSRLMSAVIWNAIPLGIVSLLLTWWFARRISLPLWQMARNVQNRDTGIAIRHVGATRAWYYEAAHLKQALLYSFNLLQDRIGKLNRASMTDPLTGLQNRRGLQQGLEDWQARGQPFGIIALDIDRFKSINDRFGHAVGDAVILRIAQIMRDDSRDTDLLCRNGGEEFLILLPGIDVANSALIAERLRARIAAETFDDVGAVTVSLGVAHYPTYHEDPQQALRLADKALYMAKEQGRNRTVIYPLDDTPTGV